MKKVLVVLAIVGMFIMSMMPIKLNAATQTEATLEETDSDMLSIYLSDNEVIYLVQPTDVSTYPIQEEINAIISGFGLNALPQQQKVSSLLPNCTLVFNITIWSPIPHLIYLNGTPHICFRTWIWKKWLCIDRFGYAFFVRVIRPGGMRCWPLNDISATNSMVEINYVSSQVGAEELNSEINIISQVSNQLTEILYGNYEYNP